MSAELVWSKKVNFGEDLLIYEDEFIVQLIDGLEPETTYAASARFLNKDGAGQFGKFIHAHTSCERGKRLEIRKVSLEIGYDRIRLGWQGNVTSVSFRLLHWQNG
ncbi:unnamed protein product [Strongylus vulgaris]|uniref:Fibronectin type-III domain-containing protein n=1 Tax=Strongylus vulgaris TaxID=40348 RepID=A0A3P7L1U3_STRVU|nr:unnamed protein product [Strongylus vulgaris]